MSYIVSIKTAILFFPVIAFLFTIPFILHQYHKYGSIHPFRVFIIYSFILYMMVIYFLVILPLPKKEDVIASPNHIRLVPFTFINDFIRETSFRITNPHTYIKSLLEPCFYTVVFNIFMTVPFGMYLRYYFACNFKKTIFYSFLLSLFFELTQLTGLYYIYPHPYRIFDVDDLIMNTLGGMIGYFLLGILKRFLPTRKEIDAHALEVGKKVSGLRRITLFCLDCFLYIFITIFTYLFIQDEKVKYITFIIYYGAIPTILNGKTLAGKFLNVRIEYYHYKSIKMIVRSIFLYVYYFMIPIGILFLINFLKEYFQFTVVECVWLYMIFLLVVFLFYIFHIFLIIKNKHVYYDSIFHVKYKSTIGFIEEE